MFKLAAKELRQAQPEDEQKSLIRKNPLYIILDNVLDTYNIGAIFRLADAVSASGVFLCGMTETPPNTRIKKASINTTEWVNWRYYEKTSDAIANLRKQIPVIKIYSTEQDKRSVPYNAIEYKFPLAFVVGHETYGVSKEVIALSDQVIEIPMWGVNKSLNVMVSLGIVLYEAMKYYDDKTV